MKKKIVSMILSLSLVISGLPLTVANAAEPDENEFLQEEASNLDEEDEADETDSNTNDETETADVNQTAESVAGEDNVVAVTKDYSNINVNSEGKAVGSDGVTYDNVVYLSADTVAAFDTETQDDYTIFCDTAAEWAADGIEDMVIAVDEDGALYFSCYVPGTILAEAKQELIEEALAAESEENEKEDDEKSEDVSEENDVESTETVSSEENTKVEEPEVEESETITDDATSDKESETESDAGAEEVTENASEEITVDESTEEISNDDLENSNSVTDNTIGDDLAVEAPETDSPALEELSEDVFVEPKAENMELIPDMENEQIELVDSVDIDVIDLGYGMNSTLNATLLSESYFSKQLKGNESKVYNAARKRLTTGNTTFALPSNTFSKNNLTAMINTVASAIAAIILTDAEKVEWFAIPGGFGMKMRSDGTYGTYNILTGKIISCTIEVDKSSYYSQTIEEQANAQVSKLAAAAQEYAMQNYPTLPAYGVVEYFDKWICESNYYNTPGGVEGTSGPEVYYYCHSSYGALLKGYAVCESYAKAMSRLLDAVRIPNMYVIGDASDGKSTGGHAWNYVQMPDANWYLLDSTWNNPSLKASDASEPSTKKYLLSAGDSAHLASGKAYNAQSQYFTFPELSTKGYEVKPETITLNETTVDLAVKQKVKLSCDNKEINNVYSTWSSSNTSVAKVDKKGNVTAVAPGKAVITLSTLATAGVEISASCTVNVYQVKNILSTRTGKATDNVSLGTNGEEATLFFNVDVGGAPYTAKQLIDKQLPISSAKNAAKFSDVKATSSKKDIAEVTTTLVDNTIEAKIKPKNAGSSVVTLEFGGKKATIKVTVGELITESMFDIDWKTAGVDETSKSIDYTGKAIAPKVTKKSTADKAVKFKTTYLNNKNAGTASVIISGTGKYGGEIKYNFKINELPIDSSHIDFKLKKTSNVYNAAVNPAKATVKYINGTKKTGLKLNTDYQIVYKKGSEETNYPVDAGEYTLTIKAMGNYSGECAVPTKYTISKCEINKAKVTLSLSNALMTPGVKATVKLGKNDLLKSDYKITYYSDKDCKNEVSWVALKPKTKYYALITAAGENMENNASKKYIKAFKSK